MPWIAETKLAGEDLQVTYHDSEQEATLEASEWVSCLGTSDEIVVCQVYREDS